MIKLTPIFSCVFLLSTTLSCNNRQVIPMTVNTSGNDGTSANSPYYWKTIYTGGFAEIGASSGTALLSLSDSYLLSTGFGSNGSSTYGLIQRISISTGTVDLSTHYQLQSGGNTSFNSAVFKTSNSTAFVSGTASQNGVEFSVLLRSSDQGKNWDLVKTYQYSASQDSKSVGISLDTSGSLFWAHSSWDGTSRHWVVLKSLDDGTNWTQIDDYQLTANQDSAPTRVYAISSSQVIVVGQAYSSGSSYWITRMTTDGGTTWSNIDSFQYRSGSSAIAADLKIAPNQTLFYVIGEAKDENNLTHWIVRTSSDSGSTWSTFFESSSLISGSATGSGLELDSTGNLIMIGSATGNDGLIHWITSRIDSSGDLSTFTFLDEFQLDPLQESSGSAILRVSENKYYTTGRAKNSFGIDRWVIREYKK